MKKQFPQKNTFDRALKLKKNSDSISKVYIVISFLIPLATFVPWFKNHVDLITLYGGIVAIVLIAVKEVTYYLFIRKYREAEKVRRKGFIENTFNIQKGDKASVGYYDNENISFGLKKMLANVHESAFFTNKILKNMEPKMLKIVIIILAAFFALTLGCHSRQYIVTVLGAVNFWNILKETMDLEQLTHETDSVLESCEKLCNYWSDYDRDKLGEIVYLYNWYETALANCLIIPDEKIYDQNKERLTNEWKEMKKRFHISERSKH